jgi:aspartate aminotransferase-like enzyme
MLAALRQALREFPGVEQRRARYTNQAAFIRRELRARGLDTAVPDKEASCTISTLTMPAGWCYDSWFEANYNRGFVLYACKAEFRERFFQLSTMGEITDHHLSQWLRLFDDLISAA